MTGPLLRVEDLHVRLPLGADRPFAVEAASLEIRRDEVLCLVGESGSGKSLLARAIPGLLPDGIGMTGGRIWLEDEDLLQVNEVRRRELRGSAISMVFQEPMSALNPLMTVGRQIEEVLEVHTDLAKPARRARVRELMVEVRLPDPVRIIQSYPHQISGGQRQRAMIAMALVLEPKLLIADEPTTALDVTTQARILKLIRDLQARHGMAVLLITHDFGVVAEIADRVAVMEAGRIVETGTVEQVLNRPWHPCTRKLIAAVPDLTPKTRSREKNARPVLQIERLNKTWRTGGGLFGGGRRIHAVKNLDLILHAGETLGLVGESGSGKSTVAKCALRLTEVDAGRIRLNGVDLARLSARRLKPHRQKIQMIFQDPYGSLNPRHPVGRLIAEGMVVHGRTWPEARARTRELLELVGLDAAAAGRHPHAFSGGQRQRIGIARALALEPTVLVADEPLSALDVSVQADVLRLLADLRDRLGLSLLFITHDLRVAAEVCDRIAVMRAGEVVETGPVTRIFTSPEHPYTRELLASVPGRAWRRSGY